VPNSEPVEDLGILQDVGRKERLRQDDEIRIAGDRLVAKLQVTIRQRRQIAPVELRLLLHGRGHDGNPLGGRRVRSDRGESGRGQHGQPRGSNEDKPRSAFAHKVVDADVRDDDARGDRQGAGVGRQLNKARDAVQRQVKS
jgi:hypothetical protein